MTSIIKRTHYNDTIYYYIVGKFGKTKHWLVNIKKTLPILTIYIITSSNKWIRKVIYMHICDPIWENQSFCEFGTFSVYAKT